jgi:hypothetical protein
MAEKYRPLPLPLSPTPAVVEIHLRDAVSIEGKPSTRIVGPHSLAAEALGVRVGPSLLIPWSNITCAIYGVPNA